MARGATPPLTEYRASRIALIKPSALGDIVHSLPVLGALRERYPAAHITWVINHGYEALVCKHPALDAVLPFDRGASRGSWLRGGVTLAKFLRRLRAQAFDLVIDLQGLLRTGLMTWATGAPRRIGLRSAREGAARFYTDCLRVPDMNMHAVDRYWLVAEALGVGQLPKRFHVPVDPADARWAAGLLLPHPRPWVVMSLGTRWETKRWPVAHFAALAERILRSWGGTLIVVGGTDEARLGRQFQEVLGHPAIDLTGQTTLGQLIAVLAEASIFIGNDSGPLHIAAALGRPVVAPFTCTSPSRTGPYGQLGTAVATSVWCAASYLKRCSRMDCMKELTPDRLWPAVESAFATCQRQSA